MTAFQTVTKTQRVSLMATLRTFDSSAAISEDETNEEILNRLRAEIYYYLTRNFEYLIRICYRIELPESEFAKALGGSTMDHVAELLADSTVKITREKIATIRSRKN